MYVNKCHVSKQLLVGNFPTDFKSIISFLAKHMNFNYRNENWKSELNTMLIRTSVKNSEKEYWSYI